MQNKIPNPDIIGYEGAVGHEKAVHKWFFTMPRTLKKSGKTKWMKVKEGRYVLVQRGKEND
jgi:hypothetical protein